jgi:GNAT superfamily N-acetyltransferase
MGGMIRFTAIVEHERGTILALLCKSYEELVSSEGECWEGEREKWEEFDGAAFENPETVGACVFVTCLDGEAIGFGSWDPRGGPEPALIGHNCVLPEFRGRGYGKRQIEEIVGRLKAKGFKKAAATTGEHAFFEPARRMYEACGFREVGRSAGGSDPRYGTIRYEMELEPAGERVEA